jgi:hypothetical protein
MLQHVLASTLRNAEIMYRVPAHYEFRLRAEQIHCDFPVETSMLEATHLSLDEQQT